MSTSLVVYTPCNFLVIQIKFSKNLSSQNLFGRMNTCTNVYINFEGYAGISELAVFMILKTVNGNQFANMSRPIGTNGGREKGVKE